jgi:hypothetical protein
MTIINCCKDCQKRHLACHSNCKEYKEQKEEFQKRKEDRRNFLKKEHEIGSCLRENNARKESKKKWGYK